jgi:hypothetical protein
VKRVRLWLALGLVAVAAVAVLGPASSAVGFFSRGLTLTIQVKSPATLHAKGAAIDVPIDVVCTSPTAFVDVQVTQRVGGGSLAQGFGGQRITCTGQVQGITVTMAANGSAFKNGTAFAQATISGCQARPRVCGTETSNVDIAIGKAPKAPPVVGGGGGGGNGGGKGH